MGDAMPDTGSYMIAAYIVTAVVVLGYAWKLWRQGKDR